MLLLQLEAWSVESSCQPHRYFLMYIISIVIIYTLTKENHAMVPALEYSFTAGLWGQNLSPHLCFLWPYLVFKRSQRALFSPIGLLLWTHHSWVSLHWELHFGFLTAAITALPTPSLGTLSSGPTPWSSSQRIAGSWLLCCQWSRSSGLPENMRKFRSLPQWSHHVLPITSWAPPRGRKEAGTGNTGLSIFSRFLKTHYILHFFESPWKLLVFLFFYDRAGNKRCFFCCFLKAV